MIKVRLKISLLLCLMIGLAIFVPCYLKTDSFCFIKDRSNSLPYHFYLGFKGRPKRMDYVLLKHNKFSYPLIKRIMGQEGDEIAFEKDIVFVNGISIGRVLEKSPFSGQKISSCILKKVPEGHVFVCGSHEYSFDSRYEEFGMIPIKNLKAVLWPIF